MYYFVKFLLLLIYVCFGLLCFGSEGALKLFQSKRTLSLENEQQIEIQYYIIKSLIDYLALEELKKFHLVSKKTHQYASEAGFYELFLTIRNNDLKPKKYYAIFQENFHYNNDFRLCTLYRYMFGFPHEFSLKVAENWTVRPQITRKYYSEIPSITRIKNFLPTNFVYQSINKIHRLMNVSSFGKYCVYLGGIFFDFAIQLHSYTNEQQHDIVKQKIQQFIFSDQLWNNDKINQFLNNIKLYGIKEAKNKIQFSSIIPDFIAMQRYCLSIVLAVSTGLFIHTPKQWYDMFLTIQPFFPLSYQKALIVALYNHTSIIKIQYDDPSNNYLKTIFALSTKIMPSNAPICIFSARFISAIFTYHIRQNNFQMNLKHGIERLLFSSIVHKKTKLWIIIAVIHNIFINQEIIIDFQLHQMLDSLVEYGLSLQVNSKMLWFLLMKKIFLLRYHIDNNIIIPLNDFLELKESIKLDKINIKYRCYFSKIFASAEKKFNYMINK